MQPPVGMKRRGLRRTIVTINRF